MKFDVEEQLTEMRRLLGIAQEFEQARDFELAKAYVAMAANKLSLAVSFQYHVLPMHP